MVFVLKQNAFRYEGISNFHKNTLLSASYFTIG